MSKEGKEDPIEEGLIELNETTSYSAIEKERQLAR